MHNMEHLALVNQALSIVAKYLYTEEIRIRDTHIRELNKEILTCKIEMNEICGHDDNLHYCKTCDRVGDEHHGMNFCEICANYYHADCCDVRLVCEICLVSDCRHERYCIDCNEMEFVIPCQGHFDTIFCVKDLDHGCNCNIWRRSICGTCVAR